MANTDFQKWMQAKQIFNEAEEPKAGDAVYFGLHDMARNNFTMGDDKRGEIVDVDPINEKIKVIMDQDPYKMGYRKLENSKSRERRKKMGKDDKVELSIPIHHCKDVSGIAPDGSKTWLIVDRNTKYQQNLNKKLNKFMQKDSELDYMNNDPDPQIDPSMMPAASMNAQPGIDYQMINREVVPVPVNQSPLNMIGWKQHQDNRSYGYF